jgi:hypothetical protein
MIIKELSNKELVKGYREVKKAFIKADLLGEEEKEIENKLDEYWNEISDRNIDLRNYL